MNSMAAGSIFVNDDGQLPNLTLLQRSAHSSGWAEVTNVHSTFGKDLPDAGWTFFYMAGEMKSTVFGFNREKALATALGRLIAGAKGQHCNSIEITQVTGKSFLQIPYVSVTAHARHLQRGRTFAGRQ
jgi:hypothetical protein